MKDQLRRFVLLVLLLGIPAFALFGGPGHPPTSPIHSVQSSLLPETVAARPRNKRNAEVVEVRPRDPVGNQQIQSPRLDALERRLQQLGATYYRLEVVGSGQSYEFICEIPSAGGEQRFEVLTATGRGPLEPVERVLAQIQQR